MIFLLKSNVVFSTPIRSISIEAGELRSFPVHLPRTFSEPLSFYSNISVPPLLSSHDIASFQLSLLVAPRLQFCSSPRVSLFVFCLHIFSFLLLSSPFLLSLLLHLIFELFCHHLRLLLLTIWTERIFPSFRSILYRLHFPVSCLKPRNNTTYHLRTVILFLVACTRLYTPLCLSVRPLAVLSVRHTFTFFINFIFLSHFRVY